ncbi:MAG: GntR family transcriptional regulator [Rhodospirillales bacterium]|nr:GntR family transcriptional regulator [Rhodospirillales bacterium]
MGSNNPSESEAGQASVHERLKLMAMTYQFRPGERINEIELSAKLGVSRTPVREALNRLMSEGFVTAMPGRGFHGRLLDAKEIYDLYEARRAIEQAIIRLVCARATDEQLDEFQAFAEARPQAQDGKSMQALLHDEEYHLRLATLSGNSEYRRIIESINDRIHFVRWIDMRMRDRLTADGHLRLVRLLRSRDEDACAEDVGRTIQRRYDEIVEVIRNGIAEIYLPRPD